MKSYNLTEAALTDDGIPLFKFETELREGRDFDGMFQIQFAAVEQEGQRLFAVNSPRGILAIFEADDSRRLAQALADTGKYIICANYENRGWEEPSGYATVIMGRDIGADVDYRSQYELSPEEHEAVKDISAVLSSEPSESANM